MWDKLQPTHKYQAHICILLVALWSLCGIRSKCLLIFFDVCYTAVGLKIQTSLLAHFDFTLKTKTNLSFELSLFSCSLSFYSPLPSSTFSLFPVPSPTRPTPTLFYPTQGRKDTKCRQGHQAASTPPTLCRLWADWSRLPNQITADMAADVYSHSDQFKSRIFVCSETPLSSKQQQVLVVFAEVEWLKCWNPFRVFFLSWLAHCAAMCLHAPHIARDCVEILGGDGKSSTFRVQRMQWKGGKYERWSRLKNKILLLCTAVFKVFTVKTQLWYNFSPLSLSALCWNTESYWIHFSIIVLALLKNVIVKMPWLLFALFFITCKNLNRLIKKADARQRNYRNLTVKKRNLGLFFNLKNVIKVDS